MALSTVNREIRATRHSAPRDSSSVLPEKTWKTYEEYLQTPVWRKTRGRALAAASWKCSKCSARIELQVHHLNYLRVGSELLTDLQVLCRACHEGAHVEQDQQQHTGVYIKLVALVLASGTYESFSDLLTDVKDACRKAGVPYNSEAVWAATRDLDAKRKGILDAPERVMPPRPEARDYRPFGLAESVEIMRKLLNVKVGLRSMPASRASMEPDAVNRFRQDNGLWNRPDLEGRY